jgi:anti-sigma factor (TIGR02949 family)
MTEHPTTDPEMPCRDLVEVVTAYLDGALDDVDRRRFEAHLAECEECVAYVDQIRATIAGAERSGAQAAPLPPDLREGVRLAFRDWAS